MNSVLLASAALAVASAASLEELVKSSLAQGAEVDATGVYNCENKCQNLLGFLSYANAQEQQANGGNNEYRGCILGCNRCSEQRDANPAQPADSCFDYCKNYVYTNGDSNSPAPIKKGIIEPDKACIIGCVINLCQGLCTGNEPWSNSGSNPGCQIQTGYGVQTYSENANAQFDQCCSNLQNVCTYAGPKTGPMAKNYNAVVRQAHRGCDGSHGITSKSSVGQMCDIYNDMVVKGEC